MVYFPFSTNIIVYKDNIMPTGKLVRISPNTMEKLAEKRAGWESPDDCINRLLTDHPCTSEPKKDESQDDE